MDSEISHEKASNILEAVADERRRSVIKYLSSSSSDVATVREIAEYVVRSCSDVDDEEQAAIRLHHSSLPLLDETGLLDYDPRSNTVRYHGDTEVVDLLDSLQDYLIGG